MVLEMGGYRYSAFVLGIYMTILAEDKVGRQARSPSFRRRDTLPRPSFHAKCLIMPALPPVQERRCCRKPREFSHRICHGEI